jgi:putative tricarboxylic transport membrane protein
MAPGHEARRDRWSAAGLAVLALAYLGANREYALDTLATPGPGLFPLVTGLALLLAAAWLFAAAGRGAPRADEDTPGARAAVAPGPEPSSPRPASAPAASRRRAALAMAAAVVLYAAVLPVAGFLASSFALVVVAARLMGAPGWWRPIALAAGVCAASHVLFVVWLGVPLPAGWLW